MLSLRKVYLAVGLAVLVQNCDNPAMKNSFEETPHKPCMFMNFLKWLLDRLREEEAFMWIGWRNRLYCSFVVQIN